MVCSVKEVVYVYHMTIIYQVTSFFEFPVIMDVT